MKTLRRIVVVGLLLGSYHIGMAQNNASSSKEEVKKEARFESDAEKAAWIQANPEKYKAEKAQSKSARIQSVKVENRVESVGRTAAPAKTETAAPAHRPSSTHAVGVGVAPGKGKSVGSSPTRAVRVNNTVKALPADYKPAVSETKQTDK